MWFDFSDDIWVISHQVDFNPTQTFIAKSTYYGPSSSLEVEIEPLYGYCPSNWQNGGKLFISGVQCDISTGGLSLYSGFALAMCYFVLNLYIELDWILFHSWHSVFFGFIYFATSFMLLRFSYVLSLHCTDNWKYLCRDVIVNCLFLIFSFVSCNLSDKCCQRIELFRQYTSTYTGPVTTSIIISVK